MYCPRSLGYDIRTVLLTLGPPSMRRQSGVNSAERERHDRNTGSQMRCLMSENSLVFYPTECDVDTIRLTDMDPDKRILSVFVFVRKCLCQIILKVARVMQSYIWQILAFEVLPILRLQCTEHGADRTHSLDSRFRRLQNSPDRRFSMQPLLTDVSRGRNLAFSWHLGPCHHAAASWVRGNSYRVVLCDRFRP